MTSHIMQIYAEMFLEFDCGPNKKREFMQQLILHLLIYACMDEDSIDKKRWGFEFTTESKANLQGPVHVQL